MKTYPQPTDREAGENPTVSERAKETQNHVQEMKEHQLEAVALAKKTKPHDLKFTVKLSRRMTSFLSVAALLLLWFFGVESLTPWGFVFNEPGQIVQTDVLRAGDMLTTTTTVDPRFKWAAALVVIMALVILYKMIRYLLRPPTLLAINDTTLFFGIGWAYDPYPIPLELIESVEMRMQKPRMAILGVWGRWGKPRLFGTGIIFKEDPSLPGTLATSSGISYGNHTLFVRKSYSDKSPTEIANAIEAAVAPYNK